MPIGVPSCDVERGFGEVRGHDIDIRPLARERNGNAAAPGADIGNARLSSGREPFECGFDHKLGLGARNQDRWRHLEIEIPEFAVADNVGERLTSGAAGDKRCERVVKPRRQGIAAVSQKSCGVPAEDVLRQQPRIQVGLIVWNAGRFQLTSGLRDTRVEICH